MDRFQKYIGRLLLPLLLSPLLAPSVWAHAFPTRSDPKVGSEIGEAPPSIRIWFDGDLEPAFSGMRLFDSEGREVDHGGAGVDEKDPALLTLPVSKIGPGKYRVQWEAVAKDGHRTEGDFTFKIK